MKRALLFSGGIVLAFVAALYLGAMGYMAWHERAFVFIPDHVSIGDVPPGYGARIVDVPGGGTVLTWSMAAASADKPTFVFFTGNAARIVDFVATGEAFHRQGWGVVLASYRGYSGNAGAPSEDGLMADARAVLASLPKHGKLIIWGHSLGSGVAARMAREHRGDALVLESAYTSAPDVAARHYWFFPVHWLMRDRFETESLVDQIRMPVLVIHGTDDPVIPFDMGETLAHDFGARATFVPLDGVGHIPHQVDLTPVVAKWLAENRLVR
ncbi:MAG TPA: alpha/beta fold hydrolase [Rhizomicrobium sp.]|jgi:hypothetical protein